MIVYLHNIHSKEYEIEDFLNVFQVWLSDSDVAKKWVQNPFFSDVAIANRFRSMETGQYVWSVTFTFRTINTQS